MKKKYITPAARSLILRPQALLVGSDKTEPGYDPSKVFDDEDDI